MRLLTVLAVAMFLAPFLSVHADATALTLEQAIQQAKRHAPQLREAKANVEISAAQAQQAAAWLNPEFSFEAENFAGGGEFSGTDVAEFTYALSQQLELGGKRSARQNAALQRLKADEAEFITAEAVLVRDVTTAFMRTAAMQEGVSLAEEQTELAQAVLKTVSKRVAAAREPEIQRHKAQVAYANATLEKLKALRELQAAQRQLAALTGQPVSDMSLLTSSFMENKMPGVLATYLAALEDLPQLQRYQHLEAAGKAEVSYEKAQAIPDPTFNLGVRDFNEQGEQALVAGLSFPIPVFNRNQGGVRKALGKLSKLSSSYDREKLELEQKLTQAWQTWQQASQEAKLLESEIIPAAQSAFKLAREGYDKGRFPYLEVLDAQRTLFEMRAQFYDTLLRLHTAQAEVSAMTPTYKPTENSKDENDDTTN